MNKVMTTDDMALVRQYADHRSESAFAALVTRHTNLVYSTALRQLGRPDLAEEVTQAVFVLLARKAHSLGPDAILPGWLHRAACYVASGALKRERRRQHREQEAYMRSTLDETNPDQAWEQLAPLLDDAMLGLSDSDRNALVLRFFEDRNLATVGAALGVTEDAAKKRVARALERLRRAFARRKVALSTGALSAALAARTVHAAPPALAETARALVLGQAHFAGAPTSNLIQGALKTMAWTKARTALAAAIAAASVVAPFLAEHQARAALLRETDFLQQQRGQIAALQNQNQRLTRDLARAALFRRNEADLERLRGEAASLEQEAAAVTALREENRQLEKSLLPAPVSAIQSKELAIAKMSFSRSWMLAFYQFSQQNNGQFPTNFAQALAYLPDQTDANSNISTNDFDIVFSGPIKSLPNPQNIIVLREIAPASAPPGDNGRPGWLKTYAFADGHAEVHRQDNSDFTAYENAHLFPPPDDSATPP